MMTKKLRRGWSVVLWIVVTIAWAATEGAGVDSGKLVRSGVLQFEGTACQRGPNFAIVVDHAKSRAHLARERAEGFEISGDGMAVVSRTVGSCGEIEIRAGAVPGESGATLVVRDHSLDHCTPLARPTVEGTWSRSDTQEACTFSAEPFRPTEPVGGPNPPPFIATPKPTFRPTDYSVLERRCKRQSEHAWDCTESSQFAGLSCRPGYGNGRVIVTPVELAGALGPRSVVVRCSDFPDRSERFAPPDREWAVQLDGRPADPDARPHEGSPPPDEGRPFTGGGGLRGTSRVSYLVIGAHRIDALRTTTQFVKHFAPVESEAEAMAFVSVLTDSRFAFDDLFRPGPSQGWILTGRYFVDEIHGSRAARVPGGFEVFAFANHGFGCQPRRIVERRYFVSTNGDVELQGEKVFYQSDQAECWD